MSMSTAIIELCVHPGERERLLRARPLVQVGLILAVGQADLSHLILTDPLLNGVHFAGTESAAKHS